MLPAIINSDLPECHALIVFSSNVHEPLDLDDNFSLQWRL